MRLKSRFFIATCGLIMSLGTVNLSYGQLPSQGKSSLLNYFGRFHGIGFSDGYHACPDQQCGPGRSRMATAGFSTFYGEPTAPPPSRFQRPVPSYSQLSTGYGATYSQSTHGYDLSASYSDSWEHHPATITPHSPSHSAIPSNSILMQDEQPVVSEPRPQTQPMIVPRGRTFEPIPAPVPDRSMDQTKRAIPGTTRPYHANSAGQPIRR